MISSLRGPAAPRALAPASPCPDHQPPGSPNNDSSPAQREGAVVVHATTRRARWGSAAAAAQPAAEEEEEEAGSRPAEPAKVARDLRARGCWDTTGQSMRDQGGQQRQQQHLLSTPSLSRTRSRWHDRDSEQKRRGREVGGLVLESLDDEGCSAARGQPPTDGGRHASEDPNLPDVPVEAAPASPVSQKEPHPACEQNAARRGSRSPRSPCRSSPRVRRVQVGRRAQEPANAGGGQTILVRHVEERSVSGNWSPKAERLQFKVEQSGGGQGVRRFVIG